MNQNLQNAIDSIQAGDADYQSQIASLNAEISALQNVKVYPNQERTSWNVDVGQAANSSGNTAVASYAQSVPTDKCAFLELIPNGAAYANAYFYKNRLLTSEVAKYTYEGFLMLPGATDSAASQAIELDIEHRLNGTAFNTGFQWDFAEKILRVWSRSSHSWVSTGVSLARWSPTVWQAFTFETRRDSANVYYDSITINGITTDLSSFSFPAIQLAEADCVNNALQLDGNSAGAAYTTYIDAVKLMVQ